MSRRDLSASPAGKSRRAWVLLVLVILLGTWADLWSKQVAFDRLAPDPVEPNRAEVVELTRAGEPLGLLLPPHAPTVFIPSVLEFKLVLNRGAVFGLGAGGRWFFIAFTGIAFGVALWMFARWTMRGEWLTHVSIGLVIAGGLGNLYDRVRYACVRDFLHPLPGVEYPFGISTPWSGTEIWPYVSNIADLWLIIGIVGVMIRLARPDKPHSDNPEEDKPETD
ncbi:MAG: signal peptidase II [Planctomycetota bacterium]